MKSLLVFSASVLIGLLFTGCTQYDGEQTETIPVEYTMGIDLWVFSPVLKSGGTPGYGDIVFFPGENPIVKANAGKILNIKAKQITWSATGLAAPIAVSEARMIFSVPKPGAMPDDPISDRWTTTGWYVNNSTLQSGVNYTFFPGTDTLEWNRLSTMLFANDTIRVSWEDFHDEVPNPYRINITVLAEMKISR